MIVYLLLVAAAVALAILCFVLGFWLILSLTHILILIVGLGIVAVGVPVLGFLIKFIFSVSKAEDSEGVEIQEVEQPRLFAFIRELTTQTETRFPKKIILVPKVNAAVFSGRRSRIMTDLSRWRMQRWKRPDPSMAGPSGLMLWTGSSQS